MKSCYQKQKEKAIWDEQKKMWIKCTIVITNVVAKRNDLYITVYRLNNNRWKRRRSTTGGQQRDKSSLKKKKSIIVINRQKIF